MPSWLYLKFRSLKFLYQRLTRGWDDSETWSLDSTLAKLILPRLKRFNELKRGYPGEEQGASKEEWDEILGKMIYAFEHHASEDKYIKSFPDKHYEKVEEGMHLFGKWFGHLWW